MVEYGLLASKSSAFLSGIIGQMQGLWDAIPFGSPVAIGAGIAMALYLVFSEAVMREKVCNGTGNVTAQASGVILCMYEHKRDPLLTAAKFKRRLVHHASIAMGIVTGSLAMGVIGFHFLADLAWIDALLNAAMLLGGMGPVGDLQVWSAAGKIFASFYALYSGIIFLISPVCCLPRYSTDFCIAFIWN